MSLKSSVKFAGSLIFPKAEKKSSARASLFGAILCIGLSIVPLIVVTSVANGMIEGMTERLIGLSTGHLQAYVAGAINEVSSAQDFIEYSDSYTNRYDEILNAFPEVGISALAAGKNYRTGAQIRAIDKNIFEKNDSFKKLFEVKEGSITTFINCQENEKVAVIGKKLAETLSLHEGDSFRIITTKTLNGNVAPKVTTFKVSAIVSSGYQELDALWIFIPIDTAFSYLSLSNANYNIMFITSDPFSANLSKIQHQLQVDNGRFANIYRWNQVHESEFQNFASTKVMLVFVMILIVLVASINVSSAVVMLVMERQKEIAILKSIGAKPYEITFSFLLAGGSCGIAGVVLGIPIGIILSIFANNIIKALENVVNLFNKLFNLMKGQSIESTELVKFLDPAYYIQNYDINIDFKLILIIAFLTVLLSVIVSIIPAIKAGKEKPLDILRKS